MSRQWRLYDAECTECGDAVEVYTDSGEDNVAYDGDPIRCNSCPQTGYVDGDPDGRHISWHDHDEELPQ